MTNSTSNFGKMLHEICAEEGIGLLPYADEWAWELTKGERHEFIFGYQFGLNLAVVQSVCNDKGMTSELLAAHGIPCVPHICFMPPEKAFFTGEEGSWRRAGELLRAYGTIVCKNNEGTGGDQVYLVQNQLELEQAAATLFTRGCSMSICPWLDIRQEYRVILLDGEIQLIFSKERQSLTGDGVRTVRELYQEYLEDSTHAAKSVPAAKLNEVLPAGEKYYFEWKHNLGRGAGVRLHTDDAQLTPVRQLAGQAVRVLNARFVSVDVIETDGGYQILEINSGVMMENLAGMNAECYELAKSIYRRAIQRMFA